MTSCKFCKPGGSLADHLRHRRCQACGGDIPKAGDVHKDGDIPKKPRNAKAIYCSKACATRNSRFAQKMGYTVKQCQSCGREIPAGRPRQTRYCSTKCRPSGR